MTPRTRSRLTLLAAAREAERHAALRRHDAARSLATHQREILGAYRARLAESWRSGAVIQAAQARRAGQFAAASQTADAQIAQAAQQAEAQFAEALAALAALKTHRDALDTARRRAARHAERQAEQQAERAQPWQPARRSLCSCI
jgi:hypothetical protein